jgi:hypothetical protein
MEHTTIAVDLAKSVFQVAVSRRPGHVDEERRLSRAVVDVPRSADAGDRRPRSLRVGTLLGATTATVGSRRSLVARARRAPVRASQQDGSHRHQSATRGESE